MLLQLGNGLTFQHATIPHKDAGPASKTVRDFADLSRDGLGVLGIARKEFNG